MYVYHVRTWCPQRPRESAGASGTGITGACEAPCRCWDPNTGPQWAHQVLLATEPALQHYNTFSSLHLSVILQLGKTHRHQCVKWARD